MMVVIDTPIWSLAVRRRRGHLSGGEVRCVTEWARLIRERQGVLIGPVLQEVLSGVRGPEQFQRLFSLLAAFPCEAVNRGDFEGAAVCHNRCAARGVAGSAVDFLICALAIRLRAAIFTTDKDFSRYAEVLGISVHDWA